LLSAVLSCVAAGFAAVWAQTAGAQGNAIAGRLAIAEAGCGACHVIPGVPGARGKVGPPLAGFGGRAYIAGTLPNRQETLERWVADAPALAPATAMPAIPLSAIQARDIAAYLRTLR
jgi:cytochrome c1